MPLFVAMLVVVWLLYQAHKNIKNNIPPYSEDNDKDDMSIEEMSAWQNDGN